MKKTKKYLGIISLILCAIFILTFMIGPYWINDLPFEYGGDLKPTYFPYYTEFRSLISQFLKTGELPFYSWNLFLGNNFWASKSFYILGDIYYYISLIFDTHFYNLFAFQTILKLIVSSLSFYCLARTFKFNKKASVIVSLCYGFSSWAMFFLGQPMFISAYSFMPLFFAGMEKYIRSKDFRLFLVATCLLLFTNYYMFFALSVFAPFYFSVRYYIINQGFKGYLISTIKLIGYYFVGVGITMVLILPSFLYIMQNDRVGTFYLSAYFDNIRIYMHQLQGLFVPSQNIIYHGYNIFETGTHVTRELCLWAGSISAIFIPQVFTDKNTYYKKGMSILYLILLLILVIPSGNMIMLGFSSPSFRWSFLIIICNLIVAGRYLSDLNKINYKTLFVTIVVISAICLFNYPITLLITNDIASFMTHIDLYKLTLISLSGFVLVYLALRYNKKYAITIIFIITIIELAGYNGKLIGFDRRNNDTTWQFIDSATSVLQDDPNELNHYLDGLDDINYSSYYRVYVPLESLYWDYSHNHNLHYQLQGVMTYDSTYAPSFDDMKLIAPEVKAFNSEWIFNVKNSDLVDFLNIKYAVVLNENELPHDNFELITDTYRGSLLVYENLNYRSLANSYTKVISYDEFIENGNNLELINDTVIAHDEDIDEIKMLIGNSVSSLENIDYHNNYMYGDILMQDDGFVVMSLPYDKGWDISVNNEKVEVYKVNGGMMGFKVNNGYNEVNMNFVPQGFKGGLVMSVVSFVMAIVLIIKHTLFIKKNSVK